MVRDGRTLDVPAPLSVRRTRHLAWWTAAGLALVVAASFASGLVGQATVTSPSMAPTHDVGSTLVTTTLGTGRLDHGDVVVFDVPQDWQEAERLRAGATADGTSGAMVKRVIGLPGDRVVCCAPGGAVIRNGRLLREPYLAEPPADVSNVNYDVVVPPGHVWVLGDHRRRSFDSRAMNARGGGAGFLPLSAVRSRVLFGWR